MSKILISVLFILLSSAAIQANQNDYLESDSYSDELSYDNTEETLNKKNPPGSKWVRVNCSRNSTCYPPAGFKYRNFNVDVRGSGCKGSSRRGVKMTKDYIITSRDCSVRGSIYVIPAAYCRGDYRFCKS
ncbi:MAG: hypothetical protein K9K67_11595 [Bacteriovoracaceae bacterium]|nr:hypothetical protein [Bacteriovoracaceae bacterium]